MTKIPTDKSDYSTQLAQLIGQHTLYEGINKTSIPALYLFRLTKPFEPIYTFYEPSVCFVAQGRKSVALEQMALTYDTQQYLLVSVSLPIVSTVLEASDTSPHLALHIEIDSELISTLALEMDFSEKENQNLHGLSHGKMTPMLHDAIFRLVNLLDKPQHIPTLSSLILREIFYLLLSGEEGKRFQNIIVASGKTARVSKVIQRLRQDYNEQILMDELAAEIGVSVSTLHHSFKDVTGLSPLQFQKHIRLQEARRLMVTEDISAEEACFQVGYNSASQFSREYRRIFGLPPGSDVRRLQNS